jgi:adenylate kinase
MQPRRFVGVTGTPGTGKKSVSPILARILGIPAVGLNEYASVRGLVERRRGSNEVDVVRLRSSFLKEVRPPAVVYGHLLPYVLRRGEVSAVVVLRCEPYVLRVRLLSRGYKGDKLRENVEAELVGVLLSESIRVFGKDRVYAVDTTRTTPESAAREAADAISRRRANIGPDWLSHYDSPEKLVSLLSADSTDPALT